jgi:hypothetical protein
MHELGEALLIYIRLAAESSTVSRLRPDQPLAAETNATSRSSDDAVSS